MNLLLLHPEQRLSNGLWRLEPRQRQHLSKVLRLSMGEVCRAGIVNGGLGTARLESFENNELCVSLNVNSAPPSPLPLQIILALPRPKMLKRVLIDVASLGVKRLVLLNSWKVDKSYWQTPELKGGLLRDKLILGLEQAGDTMLPELRLAPRFRPFVEDELNEWAGPGQRLLAHPGNHPELPRGQPGPITLAIGPEGGWIPFELEMLNEQGFQCHRFGSRILRVETALPALIGGLMQLP